MSSRLRTVGAAVAAAVVINLLVYAVGRAAGGSFTFTSQGRPAEVDAATVAGFSAVPLLGGLVAVLLLARLGTWVTTAALIAAPVLALGTIAVMTLPADFDAISTVTLALCHVTLAPIAVLAVRRLRPAPVAVPEPVP